MAEFELVGESRTEMGKGANRRLRRAGRIPAVIYGAGREPVPVSLAERDVLKQLENEAFYAHILEVKTDGRTEQAVLKAIQRHPATSQILHMDLQRVSATQMLTMHVPLRFENEDRAPGKRAGGMVARHMIEVEVRCLPKDLPEYLLVDMGNLEIGDTIHLSDLTVPQGVELAGLAHADEHTQDLAVASIQISRVIEEAPEVSEEEAEEEGLEAAEGAEGAAPEPPSAEAETDE